MELSRLLVRHQRVVTVLPRAWRDILTVPPQLPANTFYGFMPLGFDKNLLRRDANMAEHHIQLTGKRVTRRDGTETGWLGQFSVRKLHELRFGLLS